MKNFISDFSKLVKFRLSMLVVFSASITYLIGSRMLISRGEIPSVDWYDWAILVVGGFFVTAAANCFNQIIEVDFDKLMSRTRDRPMAAGRWSTEHGLIWGLFMSVVGVKLLGSLSMGTGLLSMFSIVFYAFIYTPMKRISPIAVFFGAIPGALPALIGYLAAMGHSTLLHIDYYVCITLFLIQFVWQFPHFWAIAWVVDEDYEKAGFRLLPSKRKDKSSATMVLGATLILLPVSLMPTFFGFGGYYVTNVSIVAGLIFIWLALRLVSKQDVNSARKVMFCSFFYIPVVQLVLLFDFIN